jgi:tetratricopeptide (TPR) repeat protein
LQSRAAFQNHEPARFSHAPSPGSIRPIYSLSDKRDYLNARGRAYRLAGNSNFALADFNRSVVLLPTDAETHYERSLVYSPMHDPDRAIADYSRAIAGFDPGRNDVSHRLEWHCSRCAASILPRSP